MQLWVVICHTLCHQSDFGNYHIVDYIEVHTSVLICKDNLPPSTEYNLKKPILYTPQLSTSSCLRIYIAKNSSIAEIK